VRKIEERKKQRKKERRRNHENIKDENIMACSIPYGGHNNNSV